MNLLVTIPSIARVSAPAVLRAASPYRDPGIDHIQLVVDRNAPRWLRDLKRYGWLPQA